MNTEDTRTGLDVVVEKLRALEEENQRLRAAIKKTLDENRQLFQREGIEVDSTST